jgi:hypothetical protein
LMINRLKNCLKNLLTFKLINSKISTINLIIYQSDDEKQVNPCDMFQRVGDGESPTQIPRIEWVSEPLAEPGGLAFR